MRQTEQALADAIALIESQRVEFHAHEDELVDALQIFNEASKVVRQSFGASFIQTSAGSALAAHLKNAKLNAKFAPFARILAQAASSNKLSQSAVDNILNLLQRLIDNAQATLSSERQVMQGREEAFASYSEALEDTIDQYHLTISEIKGALQILNDNIHEWEGNLADAQTRFATYTQKLADRTAVCDEENSEYATQTAQR